jgi:hypothetical protein
LFQGCHLTKTFFFGAIDFHSIGSSRSDSN